MLYGNKPERANFKLKKAKSLDSASLQVEAVAYVVEDGVTTEVEYSGKFEVVPHPDLTSVFHELKSIAGKYLGLEEAKTIVSDSSFKATKAQVKFIEQFVEKSINDLKVTGMSISGGSRDKAIINAVLKGCAINTKALGFANEEYGEVLEGLWSRLEIEVYDYFFEGKKTQLDLNFADSSDETPLEKASKEAK